MVKLIVIADDLTGALDTAVPFANKGITAAVTADMKALPAGPAGCEVWVVNTESRHLQPGEAAERVRTAAGYGRRCGAGYFYKKIDSTLRGNAGAELGALLRACRTAELMLVPAFPEMGRTVRDGRLYVNGIPLGETGFAQDPLNPVGTGDIADILAAQTDIPVHPVGNPDDLPPGATGRTGETGGTGGTGKTGGTIFLFDAESDADIHRIGEHLIRQDRIRVSAGSAGFAEFLAGMPVFAKRAIEPLRVNMPMLIVCGSLHEVSLRQIGYAERMGYPRIRLDPEEVAGRDDPARPAVRQSCDDAAALLKAGRSVILEICSLRRQMAGSGERDPLELAARLGHVVKNVIDQSGVSTLAVFGGDTAIGILNALAVERLEPLCNIVPGVALSRTVSSKYGMHLITKAGGFGGEDLIDRIVWYIENGSGSKQKED